MSNSRPTIYDVAREAGVSKSLVSLAIRGGENVSPKSRKAVEDAIKKLNYQPNRAASDLAAKRTHLIAILIDDYANPWFVDLLQGLSAVLSPEGYRLSVIDSASKSPSKSHDPIADALSMRPDGLIIARDIEAFQIPDSAPPFVIAGTRLSTSKSDDAVANDDALGAELATNYLIDLGHSAIGHLQAAGGAGKSRKQAFEAVMHAHYLDPIISDYHGPATEKSGYESALELLKQHPEITALFSSNDIMAVGALGAARELNIDVPNQLSIIGYDNNPLAHARLINLTTIDDDSFGVGHNAARLLLSKLDDAPLHPDFTHILKPSLIERGTCAPLPNR